MELWIRSQNKTNLILAKDIVVSVGNVKVYKDTELCTTVAKYETQERALEVLDEIEAVLLYEQLEKVTGKTFIKVKDGVAIYEMPEK